MEAIDEAMLVIQGATESVQRAADKMSVLVEEREEMLRSLNDITARLATIEGSTCRTTGMNRIKPTLVLRVSLHAYTCTINYIIVITFILSVCFLDVT